ncbi:MAG TPA: lipoate protein ligase C-terminal domain-containing protein [Patescibacteria group bacterium]|nr:lipoate protein ligase C-terminal domain-containing protein [Patescibacteria group bacterium]
MRRRDEYTRFRLLDSAPRSAAEHMALDKIIMQTHSQGLIPNTLRFLQFRPCVLVGLHQNTFLEVNVPYCRQNGIEINRRITGGGSLYWGPMELGWEMYAAKDTPGIPRKIEALYRLLCEAVVLGLHSFGISAAYRPVNDIEAGGQKIAGTGGTELAGSFVFQCSVLVDFPVAEMMRALRFPLEKLRDKAVKTMSERVTSVKAQIGFVPPVEQLKAAILGGLRTKLGYDFFPEDLNELEVDRLTAELPYFQSDDWIYGRDERLVNTIDCTADYKAPGGLIRVQMRLDDALQVIKYVIISGDFFAYPARAVNDLETVLKNTPVSKERIRKKIMGFFADQEVEIPGVAAEDFVQAVLLAVERGIPQAQPV